MQKPSVLLFNKTIDKENWAKFKYKRELQWREKENPKSKKLNKDADRRMKFFIIIDLGLASPFRPKKLELERCT